MRCLISSPGTYLKALEIKGMAERKGNYYI